MGKFYCSKSQKILNCIDPSEDAIIVAKNKLNDLKIVNFEISNVTNSSLKDNSQDFGYCLGVLHHIPNTTKGLEECVKKLKGCSIFNIFIL